MSNFFCKAGRLLKMSTDMDVILEKSFRFKSGLDEKLERLL
jgi:hypothetical protein